MSRAAPTIAVTQQIWFDKHDAAEYLRRLGFRNVSHSTVTRDARKGVLHEGKLRGKALYWSKNWLDDWAETL